MKTSHFIVPAIFTLAASFAVADDHKSFSDADTNSDGQLNSQELRAALPQLQTVMRSGAGASASGAAGSGAESSMMTREQISQALPGIEFDRESGPIDEDAYNKIVEELGKQQAASPASASGAAGSANQSTRGATSSSGSSSTSGAAGSTRSSTSGASGSTSSGGQSNPAQSDRNATPGSTPQSGRQ